MSRRNHREICAECGGVCCTWSGTTATRGEYEEIIRTGHEDHFVKMSDNCYVTAWGKIGACPYLEGTSCTIYEIRPLVCQKFPVVTFDNTRHFIAQCPLARHLSDIELAELIELSLQVPHELMEGAVRYLDPYGQIIDGRMKRFRLEPIDQRRVV